MQDNRVQRAGQSRSGGGRGPRPRLLLAAEGWGTGTTDEWSAKEQCIDEDNDLSNGEAIGEHLVWVSKWQ